MCLGLVARVLAVSPDSPLIVRVEMAGAHHDVNIGLLDEPVTAGDWILVHLGFAVERLTPEAAETVLRNTASGLEADLDNP